MAVTVTDGTTTVTAQLRVGYKHERAGYSEAHDIIEGDVELTNRPMGPRAGTLTLLFDDEADAFAADLIHAAGVDLTIEHDDLPAADMVYGVHGRTRLEQDDDRLVWLLEVDFLEVL